MAEACQKRNERRRQMLHCMSSHLLRSPIPMEIGVGKGAGTTRLGSTRVLPLYQSERLLGRLERGLTTNPSPSTMKPPPTKPPPPTKRPAAVQTGGGTGIPVGNRAQLEALHQMFYQPGGSKWPGRPRTPPTRPSSALVSQMGRLEQLLTTPSRDGLRSPPRSQPTSPGPAASDSGGASPGVPGRGGDGAKQRPSTADAYAGRQGQRQQRSPAQGILGYYDEGNLKMMDQFLWRKKAAASAPKLPRASLGMYLEFATL